MKKLLLLISIATAWYWFSHQQPQPQADDAETAPPLAAAPPPPTPPPQTATVPPAVKLPEGVFYLLRHTSVPTESGVHGVPVGSLLTQLEDRGATIFVTDGELQFEIRRDALTNDQGVVRSFVARDAEQQRILADRAREQRAVADARERERHAAQEREMSERAEMLAANAPPPLGTRADNPLDRGAYGQTRAFRPPPRMVLPTSSGTPQRSEPTKAPVVQTGFTTVTSTGKTDGEARAAAENSMARYKNTTIKNVKVFRDSFNYHYSISFTYEP